MRTRLPGVAALLAVVVLPGCSAPVSTAPAPPYFEPPPIALEPGDVFPFLTVYSGWWSTLPFSPGTAGLPLRVGLVRADTGEFLAGYDRPAGRQITGTQLSRTHGGPPGAILVVDLSTSMICDWFIVDDAGLPTREFQDRVSVQRRFPPLADSVTPGSFHTFVRDEDTGEVIYLGTAPEDLPQNAIFDIDW